MFFGYFRVFKIQVFKRFDYDFRNGSPGEPFFICGYDIPGCVSGAGFIEHDFIGVMILIP